MIIINRSKQYISNAAKILPKSLRYSLRSFLRLHELGNHPELNLIDFHSGSNIILDVGANEGGFAGEILLRAPLARVHCFEPNPNIFPTLKENCKTYGELNHAPRAIPHNIALGSSIESKEFLITQHHACSSFLNATTDHSQWAGDRCLVQEATKVGVSTLECFARESQLSGAKLLKIDTQGYELEVLRGAGAFLQAIEYVYAEVQFTPLYDGAPLWTDITSFMIDNGFSPLLMGGIYFSKDGKPLQADCLYGKSN